ncbi:hypothetical protein QBC46DRAFT_351094 [Diplogelasinospora grovesii]|uniref:Uncharacterized protein n=1 Tax=Diplogelasinospora grovesii TaxID=303347 RepID=A0AAN6S7Y8_9PEZI|nr:hypothetical protein QBC46DRAFT_351094 [Diplogelasinospora grovesii]
MKLKPADLPDPRPSKAHPEHRSHRKELEKNHPAYGWVPVAALAMTGLLLAFNVEKDVERCEKQGTDNNNNNKEVDGAGVRGTNDQIDDGTGGIVVKTKTDEMMGNSREIIEGVRVHDGRETGETGVRRLGSRRGIYGRDGGRKTENGVGMGV